MTIQQLQKKSRQRHQREEELWVTVRMVTELTIWNNHRRLELARRQKLIEQRKTVKAVNENGKPSYKIEYRLDNVHPMFLKKTS